MVVFNLKFNFFTKLNLLQVKPSLVRKQHSSAQTGTVVRWHNQADTCKPVVTVVVTMPLQLVSKLGVLLGCWECPALGQKAPEGCWPRLLVHLCYSDTVTVALGQWPCPRPNSTSAFTGKRKPETSIVGYSRGPYHDESMIDSSSELKQ